MILYFSSPVYVSYYDLYFFGLSSEISTNKEDSAGDPTHSKEILLK
jgi:hypothetical protein